MTCAVEKYVVVTRRWSLTQVWLSWYRDKINVETEVVPSLVHSRIPFWLPCCFTILFTPVIVLQSAYKSCYIFSGSCTIGPGHHTSWRDVLLCDGQRRLDRLPWRSQHSLAKDCQMCRSDGQVCTRIQRSGNPWVHTLSARSGIKCPLVLNFFDILTTTSL